jgi:uncharacterized repeat protein (TIGR01451 family)
MVLMVAAGILSITKTEANFDGIRLRTSNVAPAPLPPRNSDGVGRFSQLPISFEKSVEGAYIAHGLGYQVALNRSQATFAIGNPGARNGGVHESKLLRLKLLGSNDGGSARLEVPLPGKSNYLHGNDPAKWRTDVPTFAEVHFAQVYPGIDLVYHGNQGNLEHDFIVAPHADTSRISIGFSGCDHARLDDKDGSLHLRIGSEELSLLQPVAYQQFDGERKVVAANYSLSGETAAIALGAYDHSRELVIDPVLRFTTFIKAKGGADIRKIAVDTAGNIFVSGVAGEGLHTVNAYQPTIKGGFDDFDIYVAKLTNDGKTVLYATYLGSAAPDEVHGIAVDSAGHAFVTGYTESDGIAADDFPTTAGAYQQRGQARGDVIGFLSKLNPTGNGLIYSTLFSSETSFLEPNAVAIDATGNAYIGGSVNGAMPVTLPPLGTAKATTLNGFITKFNTTGSALVLSRVIAGSNSDQVEDIKVDKSNNIYLVGETTSPDFPVSANAFQRTSKDTSGGTDAFVMKLNSTATSLLYSTRLGGSYSEYANGLAIDAAGNAFVAGQTFSPDFPTHNAIQAKWPANSNPSAGDGGTGFVTKVNSTGTGLAYSTYLGGSGKQLPPDPQSYSTKALGIAVDMYDQAYVAGVTNTPDFPFTSSSLQRPPTSGSDGTLNNVGFVTTLNEAGKIYYYSTAIPGQYGSYAWAIAIDPGLNVYVGGLSGTNQLDENGLPLLLASIWKLTIAADLAMATSAPGAVKHGADLAYSLTTFNKGPDFAVNLSTDDMLPVGTSFVSYNAGGGTCAVMNTTGRQILHCTRARLDKGTSWDVVLTVKVNAAAGTKLANTAVAKSSMSDLVTANNTGSVTTSVN